MGIWSRYLEVEKRLFKAAGHVEREREFLSYVCNSSGSWY